MSSTESASFEERRLLSLRLYCSSFGFFHSHSRITDWVTGGLESEFFYGRSLKVTCTPERFELEIFSRQAWTCPFLGRIWIWPWLWRGLNLTLSVRLSVAVCMCAPEQCRDDAWRRMACRKEVPEWGSDCIWPGERRRAHAWQHVSARVCNAWFKGCLCAQCMFACCSSQQSWGSLGKMLIFVFRAGMEWRGYAGASTDDAIHTYVRQPLIFDSHSWAEVEGISGAVATIGDQTW